MIQKEDQDVRPDEPLGEIVKITVGSQILSFSWGQPHHLGTAAYWTEQTRRRPSPANYRIGETLEEEVVACILGGYGITAKVGLGAFEALKADGLIRHGVAPGEIEDRLSRPIQLPNSTKEVRYRFAKQRATRVAGALEQIRPKNAPSDPKQMRDWLLPLPGVGPKTASWIVRNWTGSETQAIVDIHLRRAGIAAGFFQPTWSLPMDYALFEEAFREIGRIASVSLAALDACIWDQMQYLGAHQSILLQGDSTL
jgi:N-glycosylase/DNA lyase